MKATVLQIDSSARFENSTSRRLTRRISSRFAGPVIHRDLTTAVPQIDETWVNANSTPAEQRTDEQIEALALSDRLISEILQADVLVIGVAVYNFGVPAALKAWIDQIARAGVTFEYTSSGPRGLLQGKRAIIPLASGGTPVGSEIDFASGYMRHIMGFIGITDVEIIAADRMNVDAEDALARAGAQIDGLAA